MQYVLLLICHRNKKTQTVNDIMVDSIQFVSSQSSVHVWIPQPSFPRRAQTWISWPQWEVPVDLPAEFPISFPSMASKRSPSSSSKLAPGDFGQRCCSPGPSVVAAVPCQGATELSNVGTTWGTTPGEPHGEPYGVPNQHSNYGPRWWISQPSWFMPICGTSEWLLRK